MSVGCSVAPRDTPRSVSEAVVDRQPAPIGETRRPTTPEAPGSSYLRERPAVFGGLRPPGASAHPDPRGPRFPVIHAMDRRLCRAVAYRRRRVISPAHQGIPLGRRRLRGGAQEPGREGGPRCRIRPPGGLHPHRHRLGGERCRQHNFRVSGPQPAPGRARGILRGRSGGDESARSVRIEQNLRAADVPLHRQRRGDGCDRSRTRGARRYPRGRVRLIRRRR